MIKNLFFYLLESYSTRLKFLLKKQPEDYMFLKGRLSYKRDRYKKDFVVQTTFGTTKILNTLNAEKNHPAFYLLLLLNGLLGPMSVRPSSRQPLFLFIKVPCHLLVDIFKNDDSLAEYKKEIARLHSDIVYEKNIQIVLLPALF